MIIAFLILYNYASSLVKYINYKRKLIKDEWALLMFDVPKIDGKTIYCERKELTFSPPLFLQRYEIVKKILKTRNKESLGGILKVIDFGCGELALFPIVKHMKGIEEYVAVDIDKDLLMRYSCRVQPLTFDYLKKRTEPLSVQVLHGSVSEPDSRLINANVVIAIELIEHLFPDVLEELPYNIFGLIQPEIAIFTTPNSEYNIFFPNFSGFRHDDHKFEWTRDQFQSWANNLVLRYPNYKVVFGGVGESPDGKDSGYCTQIAIFFRNTLKSDSSSNFYDTYKEIRKIDYPFTTETQKLEDIIQYETEKFIARKANLDCYQLEDNTAIPLKDIHTFILRVCSCSEAQIRNVLSSCGWEIIADKNGTFVLKLSQYADLDNASTSSSSCLEDNDLPNLSIVQEEEDWDVPASPITVMDGTDNSARGDRSISPAEIDHQESLTVNNCSVSEVSPEETINVNISQSPNLLEEARCSSSSCSEKNNTSQPQKMKQKSCCSNSIKNENSVEKLFILTKNPLQKCVSLENVNKESSKNNAGRFSLNIDKYKLLNCDIVSSESSDLHKASAKFSVSDSYVPRQEDSCSQSKAADSGYPNSYGQEMDLDLTPEQVDEIITESESSFDGDVDDESGAEDEEPLEIVGDIVRLGENVENGDVANNNRDGEGNNMEAEAAGAVLQFEQVIEDDEIIIGNLAGAMLPEVEENRAFLSAGDGIILQPSEVELHQDNIDELVEVIYPEEIPDWLVHILIEESRSGEEVVGAGDVLMSNTPTPALEDERINTQSTLTQSDNEQLSDLELFDEPPLELIVEGDMLGGGEPSPDVDDI